MGKIAKCLPLVEAKVTYNPGGIAVSGEVTLIGMYADGTGVYVTASTPSYHGLMFRTIKHMKDYTGGPNQWIRQPHVYSVEELAQTIKRGTYADEAVESERA